MWIKHTALLHGVVDQLLRGVRRRNHDSDTRLRLGVLIGARAHRAHSGQGLGFVALSGKPSRRIEIFSFCDGLTAQKMIEADAS